MSLWEDFLDDVFGHPNKPGKVMICFVNRYLEGMDDIKYKIKYDGHEKSGVTTAQNCCIELSPTSFNPIQTFVWSRQAKAWKKLDDVIAEPGHKKLVRKMMKTFKVPGKTGPLPNTLPNKRPDQPAPAPAPGPSPTDPQGIAPDQIQNENDQPQAKPRRPVPGEITVAQLKKIFPQAKESNLQQVADELNTDLPKYKLDTAIRRAHFFGQIRQEAGPKMSPITENLNYRSSVLTSKFGYYKKAQHHSEAAIDGRPDSVKTSLSEAKKIVIANKIYGADGQGPRLGNTQPDDGWKFRGHGFIQLTGRDNYQKFTDAYSVLWSNNVDFAAKPDLIMQFPYSLRSAVWFWLYHPSKEHSCALLADKGVTDAAINTVTKIINAGMDGAQERCKYVKLAYAAFK